MSKSLLDSTMLKLGCNVQNNENWGRTYSNPDMYIFFEKGTRSKISYVPNNYRKANNKYLESYDWKQESKHIIYLDENNLYGYKISKFYPTVDSNG